MTDAGAVRIAGAAASRVLISEADIRARTAELGQRITTDLLGDFAHADAQEQRLVLAPVMTGAIVFTADLMRHIRLPMSIEAVTVSSYPGAATQSQGASLVGSVPTDFAGAHVLLIDDILDSGRTLALLKRLVLAQRPASVRAAVLLSKRKPEGRAEPVSAEYVGFEIDDEFVVGYGLDYDGYFRNLPDIRVVDLADDA